MDTRPTSMCQGPMTRTLCGRSRPGHFRGVATIVTKLFHHRSPPARLLRAKRCAASRGDRADGHDLDFDVKDCGVPHGSGSRRSGHEFAQHLFDFRRSASQAPLIYQSLRASGQIIETGERNAGIVVDF
jgi:pantoate--beta-alanine ligase